MIITQNLDLGDICTNLYPGVDNGKRCDFSEGSSSCKSYFNECSGINNPTECNSNIPSDYSKKCEWDTTNSECKPKTRDCEDTFARYKENTCNKLVPSDPKKECIFIGHVCYEKYPNCESYEDEDENTCKGITPFNSAKNNLDYSFKCVMGDNGCEKQKKICEDYLLGDFFLSEGSQTKCSYAKASDDTKFRCIYDYPTDECYEIERECRYYNEKNENERTEAECQKIVPSNKNKKCVFENKECKEQNLKCEDINDRTQCEEFTFAESYKHCKWIESSSPKCIENYDSCNSYTGNDKKTCINIILDTPHKCILKHDSKCIKGELTCTSALNKEQCKIATPVDPKKKCIFYDGQCHEEYEKCGDYDGTSSTTCENIKLYNGKKCVYKDSKCKTEIKKCNDAIDKSECELLAKIGVSDPEYYRCNYDDSLTSNKCYEELMYCSDYNGTVSSECEHIKPYDESGNYIEVAYKCKIKDSANVKCERVLKECSDEETSSATCKSISEKLEETSNKYCTFITGTCTEQFKECESYPDEDESFFDDNCKKIIPKNYRTHHCEVETTTVEGTTVQKCVQKENDCEFYNDVNYDEEYWGSICTDIGQSCQYTPSGVDEEEACTETTNLCDDITFPSIKNDNLNYCKNQQTTEDYRVCTLKRDKLGCEEFNEIINTPISYNDLDLEENNEGNTNTQSDQNTNEGNTKQGEQTNHDGKKYGIFLSLILLYLLF